VIKTTVLWSAEFRWSLKQTSYIDLIQGDEIYCVKAVSCNEVIEEFYCRTLEDAQMIYEEKLEESKRRMRR